MAKCIRVKYVGPTNTKGSRYIADDGDGNRVIVGIDHSMSCEENAERAAQALVKKLGWHGRYVEGHLGNDHVYVSAETTPIQF